RPHLLAVDDVMVALAPRESLDLRRVGAGGRLGDAERLEADRAVGNAGQVAVLLLLASVPQQRAHHVHLRVAGIGVAAGGVDFREDGAAGADRQAGAAVLFRDGGAEIAGLGEFSDELFGVLVAVLEIAPIGIGKFPADGADGGADLGKVRAERNADGVTGVGRRAERVRNRHVTAPKTSACAFRWTRARLRADPRWR